MTNNSNSVEEIFEFALSREIEAYELYKYMAVRMTDSAMRQVCKDFAKEELKHRAKLELACPCFMYQLL